MLKLLLLLLLLPVVVFGRQLTTESEESLKKELIKQIIQSEISQYFKTTIHPAPVESIIDIAKISDIKLNPGQITKTKNCVGKIGKQYDSYESALRDGLTSGQTLDKLKLLSTELKRKEIVDLLKKKYLAIQSGVDYLNHQSLKIDKMVTSPDIKWIKEFYQEPIPKVFFGVEFNRFNKHIAIRIRPTALCLMKELSAAQKRKLGQVSDLQVKLINLDKSGNQNLLEDTYLVAIADSFKRKSEPQFREEMKLIYNANSEAVYFLTYILIAQEHALRTDPNIFH